MQQHQGQHSHQVLAQALGVTRSGFYAWRKSQGSHSPRKQAQQSLDEAVATCFRLSKGRYGAERLLVDLTEQNRYHDIKTVRASMKRQGLMCQKRSPVLKQQPSWQPPKRTFGFSVADYR